MAGIPPSVQGKALTLQSSVKANGSLTINDKMAPCGTNRIDTPDNDGDEDQPGGY